MKLTNISKQYQNSKTIYDNAEVDFNKNGIHILFGSSGSGKSTLINIILGLDPNFEGDYLVDGQKLSQDQISEYRQSNIGYMPQGFGIIPQFNVIENINLFDRNIEDANVQSILEQLKISDLADNSGKELSGGQAQRVRLARAIARDKKIIIMDEPTNNLDDDNVQIIIGMLKELSKECIIILASHDKRVIDEANYIHSIEDQKINTQIIAPTELEIAEVTQKKIDFSYLKYATTTLKKLFTIKLIPIFIMMFGVLAIMTLMSSLNKEKATYEDHLFRLQPGISLISGDSMKNSEGVYVNSSKKDSLLSVDQIESIKADPNIINLYIKETITSESFDFQKVVVTADNATEEAVEFYQKVEKANNNVSDIANNELYFYTYEALPYSMFSQGITTLEESYVEVIKGDYPADDTNQILVPESFAKTLEGEVIGQELDLNGEIYVISGYYDDFKYMKNALDNNLEFDYYASKVQNKLYYAFTNKEIPTEGELLQHFEENKLAFSNGGITSSNYLDNYNSGIVTAIVEYDPKFDVEVYESLGENNVKQDSRYTMYLEHIEDFKHIKASKMMILSIMFVVFLIFFGLIYKYRYAFRNEEFNILIDNGMVKKDIFKLLIIESVIDVTILIGLSTVLIFAVGILNSFLNIERLKILVSISDLALIFTFILLSLILINYYLLSDSLRKRGK